MKAYRKTSQRAFSQAGSLVVSRALTEKIFAVPTALARRPSPMINRSTVFSSKGTLTRTMKARGRRAQAASEADVRARVSIEDEHKRRPTHDWVHGQILLFCCPAMCAGCCRVPTCLDWAA